MHRISSKAVVSLLLAVVAILPSCAYQPDPTVTASFTAAPTEEPTETVTEEATATEAEPTETATSEPSSEPTATETAEKYVSPIDFASLKKQNEDIYAWIDIPGTVVSFPIVQHPTNNDFYVRRNVNKEWDAFGCIFTENYNSTDFTDPVTVIYGHTTGNWTMFGPLQGTYSNSKLFKEDNIIKIYLPDTEYTYEVFAAVEYSKIHILHYYNFESEIVYIAFFNDIMKVRTISSNVDRSKKPTYGDKVIILSTCLYSTNQKRYLVLAKMVNDETETED